MTISSIDTSVYYPITIPSSGVKTKYRPFRVREERALLVAQESGDTSVMLNTLESIVRACVHKCPEDLTTFDVEYIFVQLRSKSVGEYAEAVSTCVHCNAKNNIRLDLTKTTVTNNLQSKKLELSEELVVLMKYPSISDLAEIVEKADDINVEYKTIACAIETIYHGSDVYHVAETEKEEMVEFLLNRTEDEMAKLEDFIKNIPSVLLEMEYKCKECEKTNKVRINNLSDFF